LAVGGRVLHADAERRLVGLPDDRGRGTHEAVDLRFLLDPHQADFAAERLVERARPLAQLVARLPRMVHELRARRRIEEARAPAPAPDGHDAAAGGRDLAEALREGVVE